ncbi:hypothetical protein DRQ07_02850 [candidate division KSB1 bacterium]|nr:MAG: hypothetical protein DRQ07_02850 [candidate division KSB1 bacterium]
MKLISNLMKNTSIVLAGTIVRMITSFALVLIITRSLGPKGMGEWAVILSLYWLFQKIATMGLEPVIIRETAKDHSRAGSMLTSGALIGLISSFIMSFIMILFAWIVDYPEVVRISSIIMSGTLIITTVNLLFQALFIGLEKTEFGFIGIFTENIFKLVLSILVLYSGHGLVYLSFVFFISSCIRLLINLTVGKIKIRTLDLKPDKSETKAIFKTLPIFAGAQIFNAFSGNITIIILSLLLGMELVGFYSVAMRLVGFVRLVLQSYKAALQPVAARSYKSSIDDLRKFTIKSLKYLFLLTIPVSIGGTILSTDLIVFLFSDKFLMSAPLFRYLIWILNFYGISMVLSAILIGSNNQKIDFYGIIINMSIRISFAFILIPLTGLWGAAAAVICSSAAGAVYRYLFIHKNFFTIKFLQIFVRTFAAALVMGLFLILSPDFNVIAMIIAAAAVYLVSAILFKAVKPDQVPVLSVILGRRPEK